MLLILMDSPQLEAAGTVSKEETKGRENNTAREGGVSSLDFD